MDLPSNNFEENLKIIDSNIKQFYPNLNNTQLDINEKENNLIFSIKGHCNFNNRTNNFILSLRIKFNQDISNVQKLNQLIYIDFIKIKVTY